MDLSHLNEKQREAEFLTRKKRIIDNYLEGLKCLAEVYNDKDLVLFAEDFANSNAYKDVFLKSVCLAEKRGVPEELILKNKGDIDRYFMGGMNNEDFHKGALCAQDDGGYR